MFGWLLLLLIALMIGIVVGRWLKKRLYRQVPTFEFDPVTRNDPRSAIPQSLTEQSERISSQSKRSTSKGASKSKRATGSKASSQIKTGAGAKTNSKTKTAATTQAASKSQAVSKPQQISKSKPAAKPDDLKLLKGVGPVLEKKLNAEGITNFTQIAAWKKADIAGFDAKLNFRGRIERDGWVAQAKNLAKKLTRG